MNFNITYDDLLRNIKKYDIDDQFIQKRNQKQIKKSQQKSKFEEKLKILIDAYTYYIKNAFTVYHYKSGKIPEKVEENLTAEVINKICRYKLQPSLDEGTDIFISKTRIGTIGGFAIVDVRKHQIYVQFLCSNKGQGAAILNSIREYIQFKNLKNYIYQIELSPLRSAIPFYKKYGFHFEDNQSSNNMVINMDPLDPFNISIKNQQSAISLVKIDASLYNLLPEEWQKNRKVLLLTSKKYKSVSEKKKFESQFLEYIKKNKDDKNFIEVAFNNNGLLLKLLPWDLRKVAFVKIAVKQSGMALEYAGEKFKHDKEVVLIAVKQNGSALKYAGRNLKDNKEVVSQAVKKSGYALEYASPKLQNDREIVLIAVKQSGWVLKYAGSNVKDDKEVVSQAVKKSGYALEYASPKLQNDREIVLIAVKQMGYALQYASPELKNDREIVSQAVKESGWELKYASQELKNDVDFIKKMIGRVKNERSKTQLLKYATQRVKKQLK